MNDIPNLALVDRAADQLQSFRTIVITSVVATFAVPNTAIGGRMFDVMRSSLDSFPLPKSIIMLWPWFFSLPKGSLVFWPWFFSLIFLGIALNKLSPFRRELEIYRTALSRYEESMRRNAEGEKKEEPEVIVEKEKILKRTN